MTIKGGLLYFDTHYYIYNPKIPPNKSSKISSKRGKLAMSGINASKRSCKSANWSCKSCGNNAMSSSTLSWSRKFSKASAKSCCKAVNCSITAALIASPSGIFSNVFIWSIKLVIGSNKSCWVSLFSLFDEPGINDPLVESTAIIVWTVDFSPEIVIVWTFDELELPGGGGVVVSTGSAVSSFSTGGVSSTGSTVWTGSSVSAGGVYGGLGWVYGVLYKNRYHQSYEYH